MTKAKRNCKFCGHPTHKALWQMARGGLCANCDICKEAEEAGRRG